MFRPSNGQRMGIAPLVCLIWNGCTVPRTPRAMLRRLSTDLKRSHCPWEYHQERNQSPSEGRSAYVQPERGRLDGGLLWY